MEERIEDLENRSKRDNILDKEIKDKEGHYFLISGYIFGEHIVIGCVYAPTVYEPSFLPGLLADISSLSCSLMVLGGDFTYSTNANQCWWYWPTQHTFFYNWACHAWVIWGWLRSYLDSTFCIDSRACLIAKGKTLLKRSQLT
uniref:Uncharacterized protein n=1 Tax=Stegastes partitus TaxID=144197 RepID=A0A3B5A464_9TELE